MTHPLDVHRLTAVGTLLAALAVLAASDGAIPSAPLDPSSWPSWWASTDPALAVGAVLRAGATGAAGYLLLVTVLDLLASAVGLHALARLARRMAPAAWRAVVLRPVAAGALALPVLAAPGVGPLLPTPASAEGAAPESADADRPVLTMTWAGSPDAPPTTLDPTPPSTAPAPPDVDATTTTTAPRPPIDVPPPTISMLPPPTTSPPPATDVPEPAPSTAPAHPAEERADDRPADAGSADGHHVVVRGDSFWRIAERHLRAAHGREPTSAEVGAYWRRLIAANEDRLPAPGNPDLIYAGMRLVLPAV
ncbi:LysM peptidoglycan-binding domain-containing protein [Actinomarinicola tropica]|uniref:LysM peptidoglycan-binding domain-containing protein n=1 Tax=Actinomarinicola tropica TaxID=2789776 RepID=A0A5Q2RM69_9ACTN|nr:LysM domain-containing protein [Actinomarinicola tropica]QGG95661.1 LysM peptidoglycan-binding domain-containing protein [Actinomarinicola tropica]